MLQKRRAGSCRLSGFLSGHRSLSLISVPPACHSSGRNAAKGGLARGQTDRVAQSWTLSLENLEPNEPSCIFQRTQPQGFVLATRKVQIHSDQCLETSQVITSRGEHTKEAREAGKHPTMHRTAAGRK